MVDRYLREIKKRVLSARAGEVLALEAIEEIRQSLTSAQHLQRPLELSDLYGDGRIIRAK